MINYKIIDTTQAADFNAALELHHQITGEHFYEGYENVQSKDESFHARGDHSTYSVCNETGDIFYIYTCPDSMKILHKLSIHSCISNSGFNEAMVYPDCISIVERNWGNVPANRKIFARDATTVTSLAA